MRSDRDVPLRAAGVLALGVAFSLGLHEANGEERIAPNDEPGAHSYVGLPNVVGDVKGVPIYAYGRVFIHGVSPDFETGVLIQHGARAPEVKIKPRKSWELRQNYVGGLVSYQPREPRNDVQPTLAVNLIDGDPDTFWLTRGEAQPDIMPAWVRFDLAQESDLREIVLDPIKQGGAWPKELTMKVSQDAWHWTSVYQGDPSASRRKNEPLHVALTPPRGVKQFWIIANQLPSIGLTSVSPQYRLGLAGIEAFDEKG